ncbi:DUF3267 domain-containing protein [Bacillus songklensis]|uniref:DUF3267 domain-containing protein n=1 Tax=Bacillus songklensis TaxID=1069116 RepID=A0ABV8AWN9_9BACI
MIINALITIGIINIFSNFSIKDFGVTSQSISITIHLGFIIWFILLLIVHELLHLLFIPNFSQSKNTFIGLTLFGGYVYTEDELSKSRYIMITIAPFVIISIIMPITLAAFGLLTPLMKFLILVNSMASSVDILNFLLILFQIPRNAIIKSNGTKTYWKLNKSY